MSEPTPGAYEADRYPEVARFAALMRDELVANSRKGDQAGWLRADPEALLHDVTWHWAKMAMAWRDLKHLNGSCRDPIACKEHPKDRAEVDARLREHAADVANMSLMFLDRLGLLPPWCHVHDEPLSGGDQCFSCFTEMTPNGDPVAYFVRCGTCDIDMASWDRQQDRDAWADEHREVWPSHTVLVAQDPLAAGEPS